MALLATMAPREGHGGGGFAWEVPGKAATNATTVANAHGVGEAAPSKRVALFGAGGG